MDKRERKALIQGITIKTPCTVGWDNMEGGDTVRFCNQCNLNVHNLSNMSDGEIAALFEDKNRRKCVWMERRQDGSIVTNNCPIAIRKIRNLIRAYAASVLLTLSWCLALGASAQGLVDAPVDPRYGQSGEVGGIADFGCDPARDISRIVTFISFVIAFFVPLHASKKTKLKLVALELLALASIPILVHLAGTYFINHYGVLGGGAL